MASRLMRALVGGAVALGVMATAASPASANTVGTTEGCTPGYWKNHTEVWDDGTDPNIGDEPALRPDQPLRVAFTRNKAPNAAFPWAEVTDPSSPKYNATIAKYADMTMLQALQGGGGSGLDGAMRILMRATAAAYLNAGHDGIEYPYRRFQTGANNLPSLASELERVLESGNRQQMLDLAATLDRANNLGCPL
jgi:hypothetical protein